MAENFLLFYWILFSFLSRLLKVSSLDMFCGLFWEFIWSDIEFGRNFLFQVVKDHYSIEFLSWFSVFKSLNLGCVVAIIKFYCCSADHYLLFYF